MPIIITPRKSLNKAYLKVKPVRNEIESFKSNLIKLLEQVNHAESEEFNKNVLADFLKNTFYSPNYFINTKGRNDLVIHNNKTASDSVGVIIEAKRSTNASEMIRADNINNKALQELVLYYLRERITHKNLEVKNLIVTNVNEWFIFDANVFEKHFAQNKKLVQQFVDFETGTLSGIKTDFFYKEVASVAIEGVKEHIEYTYFNIADIETALRNSNKGDDTKLIPFYKLLSPQHLLKIPFANDSNSLNKTFYSELLHIIGLEETKEGSKKLIGRKKAGERYSGTLIENAIIQIESLDKLSRLQNRRHYGETKDEQLFNVAIELAITWINRILFLKLLEAQLITYHKNDNSYAFLNNTCVRDFDELNTLFFQVLAVKTGDRNSDVKTKFAKIPYLNSSLFEPAEIEHNLLFISNLSDDKKIPILSSTVLKNEQGKKQTGELNAIEYLFSFLNAYDFASDGNADIQEDSKSLINASVLGLIFEKINGYKDGSFFTPGFVTMYMSREALRKSVVQKFNENNGLDCKDLRDIYNSNIEANEANAIINSIKICDPAVGSGHFLVSALNEIIAIKAELEVLQDKDGKRLKNYSIEVVNDELIVSDEDGELYEYNPSSPASQRIQETLFNEKQTIIENCLFGVDINPNSVKICRLRLWIELLKNAYYKADGELETLPNIDINIKCGNSLISRFDLDTDLKEALKKSKLTISQYKSAVQSYRAAKSKDEKWEMERLINEVKTGFRTEILYYDPKSRNLEKLRAEVKMLELPQTIFDESAKERKERADKRKKSQEKLSKLEAEISEIKSNKLYENAFEWRFEFPEVLNENGEYVGFDVVIGNPPYFKEYTNKNDFNGIPYYQGKMDIWYSFACRGIDLLKQNSQLAFIATNNWVTSAGASILRNKIINETQIQSLIDFGSYMIFDSASIQTMILHVSKDVANSEYVFDYRKLIAKNALIEDATNLLHKIDTISTQYINVTFNRSKYINQFLVFGENDTNDLLDKIKSKRNFDLDGSLEIAQGIVTPQDNLTAKNSLLLNNGLKAGAGIFMLGKNEVEDLNLSQQELLLIKPLYTTEELDRYCVSALNKNYVIYTNSSYSNPNSLNNFPNLKAHLDKFKDIITSDNKPYGLHRSRNEDFFIGEKIVCLRKAVLPTFTYTNFDCYVSQTFNVIKTARINLKYLTALLNSSLVRYWLKNKGKMQGNLYQVDKEPLLQVPIYAHTNQSVIAKLVDNIIACKTAGTDTSAYEDEIDILICKYYDLSFDEYNVVTLSAKIGKDAYEAYVLN
ncbi:Eco57I restriction-modification methylase domain-containing protein [Methylotenera sp.]|uniref:DUF7149 domain-containing protein n=1 Tax=Methylotenera sp. TaxID=2051956 RepID=UPI002732F33B|nr:Eco57I restriction-modification methylase domain-containing protein [Methylotenera sp.]MDP3308198.1 Eco57I restriction-modification methylase domain-containing protein [Methylotenera sp.]MDP3818595.1 Eco57I restriction-modification methylase domain-containing protein [Methylotenera sp.]